MIRRVALGVVVLALLPAPAAARSMPGCARDNVPGGEWRSFGHDAANTRSQPHEKTITAVDVPTLASTWAFSSVGAGGGGDFTGTPIVADGCVYAASSRGWVFAINADTGALVWKAQLPYGGGVNSTVLVADRTLPAAKRKRFDYRACTRRARRLESRRSRARARRECVRRRRRAARPAPAQRAGTVFAYATRTQKAEGCPPGDPCVGPYALAFDQATGKLVWASGAVDSQPGSDSYGSPVIFDGVLMFGISAGSAELGEGADRDAFQGSLNFLDADDGRLIKKTYTIHPPKQPENEFAGGAVWSTPAIDAEDKVAFVGAGNPFKPQAEHQHTNAVLRFDIDRRSPRFGEITGHYKGNIDEYVPGMSEMPCYDIPDNMPPYYPQGLGSCGDIDMDFGASPNLFRDPTGRKLVGAGQKSGVYHVFDARTMEPVWTQIAGPPTQFGGIVGSTAYDGSAIIGPITIPGYVWALDAAAGAHKWVGPIVDGLHWGPPVAVANGVVYSVDFSGNLDAFDARTGALLVRRPLALGGGGPMSLSWAGVSVARNTVYAAVGVLGLADGFIVALRPGGLAALQADVSETLANSGSGGGGGGGGSSPVGPTIVSGPSAGSTGYATPTMFTTVGGPLNYLNLDNVLHDVVAEELGPDGRPLFHTPLIGLGETAPVEGLDKVVSGKQYAFYCSVHPGMRGNLIVQ